MASAPVNMASAVSLFRCLGVDIPSGSVRDHELVGVGAIEPHAKSSQPGRFFYYGVQLPPPLAIAGVGCDRSHNG